MPRDSRDCVRSGIGDPCRLAVYALSVLVQDSGRPSDGALLRFVARMYIALVQLERAAISEVLVDFLRLIVETVRDSNALVQILLGGSVLELDCDLCELTGADFATGDRKTALSRVDRKVFA